MLVPEADGRLQTVSTTQSPHPVVLYDGRCGLCSHVVQFVIARDHAERFRFLSLQSEQAATILARHDADPRSFETMYVLFPGENHEHLFARSAAVIAILRELSPPWRWAAAGLRKLSRSFCVTGSTISSRAIAIKYLAGATDVFSPLTKIDINFSTSNKLLINIRQNDRQTMTIRRRS